MDNTGVSYVPTRSQEANTSAGRNTRSAPTASVDTPGLSIASAERERARVHELVQKELDHGYDSH